MKPTLLARTPRELATRMAQEAHNVRLYLQPPQLAALASSPTPVRGLPEPEMLRRRFAGSPFADEIAELSSRIRSGRIPILGFEIAVSGDIHWRRDYVSCRETEPAYFRRIPYLDVARVGDHKVIWELNRHQHLIVLAQDVLVNENAGSLAELERQLDSWLAQNPFQRGVNWTSALEVAFRSLSWLWVEHLCGPLMQPALRRQFLAGLFLHGCHLERNLSLYFSPNTHLLGEAVALHALGVGFPHWERAETWRLLGALTVEEQAHRQIQSDGSHFERSSYYHVYALDMLLFHTIMRAATGDPPGEWRARLRGMCVYLDALLGPCRRLPFLGDDDGGRFFHPYGRRDEFARATLATAAALLGNVRWRGRMEDFARQAAWWMPSLPSEGERTSSCGNLRFPASGLIALCDGPAHVLFDTGGLGWNHGGHSHSDALSLVVCLGEEEILIDPGTYTYVGDAAARNAFRGSAAHNTVRINGLDQADPAGPFAWRGRPEVSGSLSQPNPGLDVAEGACAYRGFLHRRRVEFHRPSRLRVDDTVEGLAGIHDVELFWHLGSAAARERLTLSCDGVEAVDGWRSKVFGRREPAPVVRLRHRGALPWRCTWEVRL